LTIPAPPGPWSSPSLTRQATPSPGTIHADATAAFRQLFETSDLGGAFLLRAVFPLTGDASRIAAFEAVIGNSQGAAVATRASF
jgi:hypothetical protein